jgi:hypothetical protein
VDNDMIKDRIKNTGTKKEGLANRNVGDRMGRRVRRRRSSLADGQLIDDFPASMATWRRLINGNGRIPGRVGGGRIAQARCLQAPLSGDTVEVGRVNDLVVGHCYRELLGIDSRSTGC